MPQGDNKKATRVRGPPRRSHKKSRKGCQACRRRHMRCDETYPQCDNCTAHGCRCDYGSNAPLQQPPEDEPVQEAEATEGEQSTMRRRGFLPSRPHPSVKNTNINNFSTYAPSYTVRQAVTFNSTPDLPLTHQRLLSHIVSISTQLEDFECAGLIGNVKKIPTFITIALSHNFVMQALLAWAASHIAWAYDMPSALMTAQQNRVLAINGLQEAIATFDKATSDAVLAASILLCWQATTLQEYSTLSHGITTIVETMRQWESESIVVHLLDLRNPVTLPSPQQGPGEELDFGDSRALQIVSNALEKIEVLMINRPEETRVLRNFMTFVHSLESQIPLRTRAEQFSLLIALRSMVFWLPLAFVKRVKTDPVVMVLLAHIYAVMLFVQHMYFVNDGVYFRVISVGPVENLYQNMVQMQRLSGDKGEGGNWALLMELMEFPLQEVERFRRKMGPKKSKSS